MAKATEHTTHIGTAQHPFHYLDNYTTVTCRCCGQRWQRIDFGCALHRLMCNGVDRFDVIDPVPCVTPREFADHYGTSEIDEEAAQADADARASS